MIILVDMDNVIADLSGHASKILTERFPDTLQKEQTSQFFGKDYPELEKVIAEIYLEQGFFYNHLPIAGALEGLECLEKMGHTVRICTSHIAKSEYCVSEKILWLRKHVPGFTNKIIITKDKTLVRGDILIDDKPKVLGALVPQWEHVLYDQPYNRHIQGQRMSWDKLEEFLNLLEELNQK